MNKNEVMLDDVISDADNELINDIKKALYVLMLGDNPNQEAIELLKKGLRDE